MQNFRIFSLVPPFSNILIIHLKRKFTGLRVLQMVLEGHDQICPLRPGKKNVLVLVIGRVDFDANLKKCGPQNKYNTKKNTESRILFTCQSLESTFTCILSCYMNVLSTGLIWISSFKTF